MGASASHGDAPDHSATHSTGLARALVDTMLQLEKAADSICIHVIRDRRTAKGDGLLQHLSKSLAQALELHTREPAGAAPRTQPGTEEAFIRIDIAHARQQLLIEQGRLHRKLAFMEKCSKLLRINAKRFKSWRRERRLALKISEFHPSKAAGIDKAKLAATGQRESGVSVSDDGRIRCGHEQASCHAKMNNPLCLRLLQLQGPPIPGGILLIGTSQIAHDMFSQAADRKKYLPFQALRHTRWWCFEGFTMTAEPDFQNAIATDAIMDATSNRFYLGQFGHELIVVVELLLALFAVLANGACLKADDMPFARAVTDPDAGVAKSAGDRAIRKFADDFRPGSDERGGAIEPDLAIRKLDRVKVHRTGAEICERIVLRLQDAVVRNPDVIVGKQATQGLGIPLKKSLTPLGLQLINFVTLLVTLCSWSCAHRSCKTPGQEQSGP